MTIVTLLSDFGLSDAYVAQMKGVIFSESPNVQIVDITHGIERHNIAEGSFLLESTVPFFPEGSIHVGVVDPGVGGSRKPVVIECDRGILVGPDNGLLHRAAEKLGFGAAYQIRNPQFHRVEVSSTFHGRDIFAYSAAKLANGKRPTDVGPKLSTIARLELEDPEFHDEKMRCTVLHIDSFGNVVTNIQERTWRALSILKDTKVSIVTGNKRAHIATLVASSYSEIPNGRLGLILASQGFLEIAMKESSAARKLAIRSGDDLELRFS